MMADDAIILLFFFINFTTLLTIFPFSSIIASNHNSHWLLAEVFFYLIWIVKCEKLSALNNCDHLIWLPDWGIIFIYYTLNICSFTILLLLYHKIRPKFFPSFHISISTTNLSYIYYILYFYLCEVICITNKIF